MSSRHRELSHPVRSCVYDTPVTGRLASLSSTDITACQQNILETFRGIARKITTLTKAPELAVRSGLRDDTASASPGQGALGRRLTTGLVSGVWDLHQLIHRGESAVRDELKGSDEQTPARRGHPGLQCVARKPTGKQPGRDQDVIMSCDWNQPCLALQNRMMRGRASPSADAAVRRSGRSLRY